MEFDAISDAIITEWLKRKKVKGLSPYENANGFLKRECYRVICHFIERRAVRFFESVIRRDGNALSSVIKIADNPFHYGLTAMLVDQSVMTRNDKSLFSGQMVYAYRHSIPPRLLVGFIYQSGSNAELRRKLKAGTTEPGFEDQFRREIEI